MSAYTEQASIKCSPWRAIQSVTESPNWPMNLLWLSLAVLLQQFIVGTIFTFGYGAEILQSRAGLPGRSNPDIEPNRISDTFMRGLWPFLVYMVSAVVIGLAVMIPLLIIMAIVMFLAAGGRFAVVGIVGILLPFAIIANLVMVIFLAPICIRSMICQDFQNSFDVGWIKSFISLMYRDVLASSIVFALISIPIFILGMLMFCIGIYPAMGLLTAAAFNLMSQWYELFLARGGQPVEPGGNAIVDATLVN